MPTLLQVGDRCEVDPGGKRGEVKFVGKVDTLAAGYWIGVQYDEPVGKHDGVYGTFSPHFNVPVAALVATSVSECFNCKKMLLCVQSEGQEVLHLSSRPWFYASTCSCEGIHVLHFLPIYSHVSSKLIILRTSAFSSVLKVSYVNERSLFIIRLCTMLFDQSRGRYASVSFLVLIVESLYRLETFQNVILLKMS